MNRINMLLCNSVQVLNPAQFSVCVCVLVFSLVVQLEVCYTAHLQVGGLNPNDACICGMIHLSINGIFHLSTKGLGLIILFLSVYVQLMQIYMSTVNTELTQNKAITHSFLSVIYHTSSVLLRPVLPQIVLYIW